MADHCPEGFVWNTSVMDPVAQWKVLGDRDQPRRPCPHRHGGQPFIAPGEYARCNADLVDKIVRIARDIGRDIATPDETRGVLGIDRRKAA